MFVYNGLHNSEWQSNTSHWRH